MSKQTTPGFIHQFEPGSSNRTLLLLHGTGGNEKDLLSLGRALDPEAALLSPRGKVLENGMPRFLRRLAEGGALGYSNGANIAGGILLLRPGVLCGTALLRPMVPLVPETLPELKANAGARFRRQSRPDCAFRDCARISHSSAPGWS